VTVIRPADDHYATPAWVTAALLAREAFLAPPDAPQVWECACGNGAMAEVIAAHGYNVAASNLVDYGYGDTSVDFLKERRLRAPNIVTNPPYALAMPFIEHALALGADKAALLLRLNFVEGQKRSRRLEQLPLAAVLIVRARFGMWPGGNAPEKANDPTYNHAWYVFQRGHRGAPSIGWLDRPEGW
jgi:hypothetical protein